MALQFINRPFKQPIKSVQCQKHDTETRGYTKSLLKLLSWCLRVCVSIVSNVRASAYVSEDSCYFLIPRVAM